MKKKEVLPELFPSYVVEEFKKFLAETIQKCRCIYNYADDNGYDNFLMYQEKEDPYGDSECIGCIEGGNLLLDSTFIYRRFWKRWDSLYGKQALLPKKSKFYACLHDVGQIHLYGVNSRKQLHSIRLGLRESDPAVRSRKYFCISREEVGCSAHDKIRWL